AISPELRERLEIWKHRLPNAKNVNPRYHGFEFYSYSVMLLGLNYVPERSLPALDHVDDTNALHAFRLLRERTERLVATLPSQYEYLQQLRAEAAVAA
ncbi:MAG TPA: tryptophan 7-halogenase, partial [Thermoanaerobaculia bacterium]